MNINITIDAGTLTKWLAVTPEKLGRATSNIIQKVAKIVEREAKLKTPRRYMPIGSGSSTGRLSSSISSFVLPTQATIQPHVNYAQFVHDGTRYMRARPFMEWGLQATEPQIDGIMESEIKKALK